MKKKFLTLTIIFLVLTSELIGQNLDGIWLSSYTLETTKKHIPHRPDSVFKKAYLILDFIDNENVIFKPLGNKKEIKKYSVDKNKIQIRIENDLIKGEFSEKEIILILEETEEYIIKAYLNKITPSSLITAQIPDTTLFFNSSWSIESEPKTENYGVKFNFLDKDSLDSLDKNIVLIIKNKGLYGYTENGNYNIDFYKNHFFIGILNRHTIEENVYHFYKLENNIFYAETYENFYSFKDPPKLSKIKIHKTEYLTTKQQKDLESKLKGKWKAINNPIPFDSISSNYKKLENQSFELIFKESNDFELIKKGILVNENLKVPETVIIKGKWEISKTGNYIKLKPNDSWEKYITIEKLSNDNLKIFYDVETLEENSHFSSRTLIELTK
ncbi:MAG: hypothetical protein R3342_13365 [Lutibacter sp.]|uniref:hypothetical protein n=1 Tax=Lutibacter sp. TaxID=1925666 RepID=UPI00299D1A2A|nr:hypothetical protein [Lutibacter sp.]MDX1830523.1 hypothetical protein [Lutibacter sp.]